MTGDKIPTTTTSGEMSDPFHLHSSDHPGASLVTKLLNGDNYATWSRSMSIALSAKNKIGFIDGSIKRPSSSDQKYAGWKRCNDMVLSWLLNSIDPSLSDSVIYTELASAVWTDLKDRFSQNNAPRIFQIQREIASLHQDTMSVMAYYSKLKSLWDELSSYNDLPVCSCGVNSKIVERDELNKVMQFLMGLNDTYSAIRGQILLLQPLPSIGKIYAMVLQEERQRDITISKEVMLVDTKKIVGHTQQKGRSKLHCTHCNGTNHTVERCYHLHGFPSGPKKKPDKGRADRFDRSLANNVGTDVPVFTHEQYHQLLNLLGKNSANGMDQSQANFAGLGNEEDDWFGEAT